MAEEARTLVFYESPHKLLKTLSQMIPFFGKDREVAITRELSKKFESNYRGNLESAIVFFEKNPPKGEFVVVIEGKKGK